MFRIRMAVSLGATAVAFAAVSVFLGTAPVDPGRSSATPVPQTGHVSRLTYSVFALNGRRLVTQSEDGELIVWDTTTGRQLRTVVPAASGTTIDCQVSPDGRWMLYGRTAGSRRLLCLHAVDADLPRFTIDLTDDVIGSLARFSQCGRFIVMVGSTAEDGDVLRLLEIPSGRIVASQPMRTSLSPRVNARMEQFVGWKRHEIPAGARDDLAWLETLKALSRAEGQVSIHEATYVPNRGSEDRFSPDGELYVTRNWTDTGSDQEEVCVWHVSSGRLLHFFSGPYSATRHVEFSSDGDHFLVGIGSPTAELRSGRSGEIVRSFGAHESPVEELVFSHDGESVLTGTSSGTVTVWSSRSAEKLAAQTVPGKVTGLDVRLGDQQVAVATGQSGVTVFSLPDMTRKRLLPQPATRVAYSPDGSRLLLGNSPARALDRQRPVAASLHESDSGAWLSTVTRQPTREIVLSPDTRYALARPRFIERNGPLRYSGEFELRDVASGRTLYRFPVDSFQFVYDFPPSVASAREIAATVPQSSRGRGSVGMPFPGYVPRFRFKPAYRTTLSEIPDLDEAGRSWLSGMTESVRPAPVLDGAELVRSGSDGRYSPTVWNTGWRGHRVVAEFDDGIVRHEYVVPGFVATAATLNRERSQVFVGFRGEGDRDARRVIAIFDRKTGSLLGKIEATQQGLEPSWEIDTLTLSPDDRFLAVGFDYHNFLFDRKSGTFTLVGMNNGGLPSRQVVLFSPDSRRALFYGRRQTLWDLESARQLVDFGPYNGLEHPVFSPDGKTFFAKGEDGPKLWESATGRVLHEFERQYIELRFNADGTRMVPLQSNRDMIALWDFEAGQPVCPLTEESARSLIDVTFTPDGERLIVMQQVDQTSVLTLRDTRTGEVLSTHRETEFPFGHNTSRPFFLAEGRRVVIEHSNGATVWDTVTGKPVHRFQGTADRNCSVVLTPGGERLLTISPGESAILWSLTSGEKLQEYRSMPADLDRHPVHVRFSPDERKLVARHHRGQSAVVWDVSTGKLLARYHLLSDGRSWCADQP